MCGRNHLPCGRILINPCFRHFLSVPKRDRSLIGSIVIVDLKTNSPGPSLLFTTTICKALTNRETVHLNKGNAQLRQNRNPSQLGMIRALYWWFLMQTSRKDWSLVKWRSRDPLPIQCTIVTFGRDEAAVSCGRDEAAVDSTSSCNYAHTSDTDKEKRHRQKQMKTTFTQCPQTANGK